MKPPEGGRPTLAVAIDLGSTRIKTGRIDDRGRVNRVETLPAPALRGQGMIREGDVDAYLATARRLLEPIAARLPRGTPLGVTSQRSSFTLWERASGRQRLPLISWQDRRAADWCDRHRSAEPEVLARTGLMLSGHYAGPKLAALREADPGLAAGLDSGDLLFGTLETYLLWQWGEARPHETDLTMAARTTMVDLDGGDWSTEMLDSYGVPVSALPVVRPSSGRRRPLDLGLDLTASLADQAAGAVAALEPGGDAALVNLGTGAFVLVPVASGSLRRPGYLTAPVLGSSGLGHRFVLEGTINGAGPALDRFACGPTALDRTDPAAAAFALPDLSGLGSPHWRPRIGLTLSAAAEALDAAGRRRVVLEGLVFRVREILEDLCPGALPGRILLSGGLAADPGVARALAACLGRPVEVSAEREAGLLGAGRLAAGLAPFDEASGETIGPSEAGAYLRRKYDDWRNWLASVLSEGRSE